MQNNYFDINAHYHLFAERLNKLNLEKNTNGVGFSLFLPKNVWKIELTEKLTINELIENIFQQISLNQPLKQYQRYNLTFAHFKCSQFLEERTTLNAKSNDFDSMINSTISWLGSSVFNRIEKLDIIKINGIAPFNVLTGELLAMIFMNFITSERVKLTDFTQNIKFINLTLTCKMFNSIFKIITNTVSREENKLLEPYRGKKFIQSRQGQGLVLDIKDKSIKSTFKKIELKMTSEGSFYIYTPPFSKKVNTPGKIIDHIFRQVCDIEHPSMDDFRNINTAHSCLENLRRKKTDIFNSSIDWNKIQNRVLGYIDENESCEIYKRKLEIIRQHKIPFFDLLPNDLIVHITTKLFQKTEKSLQNLRYVSKKFNPLCDAAITILKIEKAERKAELLKKYGKLAILPIEVNESKSYQNPALGSYNNNTYNYFVGKPPINLDAEKKRNIPLGAIPMITFYDSYKKTEIATFDVSMEAPYSSQQHQEGCALIQVIMSGYSFSDIYFPEVPQEECLKDIVDIIELMPASLEYSLISNGLLFHPLSAACLLKNIPLSTVSLLFDAYRTKSNELLYDDLFHYFQILSWDQRMCHVSQLIKKYVTSLPVYIAYD